MVTVIRQVPWYCSPFKILKGNLWGLSRTYLQGPLRVIWVSSFDGDFQLQIQSNSSSNHFWGISPKKKLDTPTTPRLHCFLMKFGWSEGSLLERETLVAVPVATMCKLLTKVSWTWNIYSGHVSESIHWLLVSTHLICQSNLNGMIGAHLTVWGWLRTCKNMLYSDDEHAWTQALLMWKPGNKSCNHNSMGPMGAKLNLLWLSDYHLGHFWDC